MTTKPYLDIFLSFFFLKIVSLYLKTYFITKKPGQANPSFLFTEASENNGCFCRRWNL